MTLAALLLAGVVVGTWNANWFPSGRAEHRAHPDVEAATTAAAGRMLRAGIDRLDPLGTNDVVICLNEIRGPRSAAALAAAIGRTNLTVTVITGYRRRDRFDQQQDVILTTLPVAEANWSLWKSSKGVRPPRGYARARLIFSPAVTATVYSVHLKSNYGATTDDIRRANTRKRELPAEQLVTQEKAGRRGDSSPVIIAGDFNADPWRKEFRDEQTFATFSAAGFVDVLSLLPSDRRGTHPNRRYGDSALDHILLRGISAPAAPVIVPNDGLSDHYAVFLLLPSPPAILP